MRRQYAVKAIDKSKFEKFTRNRNTILEIESEEKMLKELRHPNIVEFIEMLSTKDTVYLVTEFMGGGDLLQRILDMGTFSR